MFDEIPEDREESFECEKCGGDVTKRDGLWQCNSCDFHVCVLDGAVCHDFGEPKVERQLNWICPSCCIGFDVMPEKCPINANGCDDLLAKGK